MLVMIYMYVNKKNIKYKKKQRKLKFQQSEDALIRCC